MSEPTRRELQKQERRNQLIDTALALYAEKGVESTTIKDIAEHAGVAQGLVYHYFESKDDLLQAIIERHNPLNVLRETLIGVADLPVNEALLLLATTAYRLVAQKRDIFIVIAREALTRPELQQRVFALQQLGIGAFTEHMRARMASGEVRPHRPEVVGRMLMGAVLAMHVSNAPEGYLKDVVDTLLRGIAAD